VSYLEGQILKDTYLELSKFGDEKQYEKCWRVDSNFHHASSIILYLARK
jgi:hypothetical protein